MRKFIPPNRRDTMRQLIFIGLLFSAALNAENFRSVWKASIFTLAAANALDAHSSWGKYELNPALSAARGNTFGPRGVVIKAGLQGALVGLEFLVTRTHRSGKVYKRLAAINFGAAAAVGSIAAHNYTVARPSVE